MMLFIKNKYLLCRNKSRLKLGIKSNSFFLEFLNTFSLKGLFLISLLYGLTYGTFAHTSSLEKTCFRFHDQWKTAEQSKKNLQKKYNTARIHFDERGEVLADKLSTFTKARFLRLYTQCMQDGCLFCDANEGSCEAGTCGPQNCHCKPYMQEGRPLCGEECAFYALNQL